MTIFKHIKSKAAFHRKNITKTICVSKKGHIGGSLSCVDIMCSIYYSKLFNFKKKDKFLLSKGHAALALYSILFDLKYSKNFDTNKFNKFPSLLTEHPQINSKLPGIEFESGSLGNGMGVGSGIAYANKLLKKKSKVIVLIGDGELYEGSCWEALLLSSQLKLSNILFIVDRNRLITLGSTENITKLNPLKKKFNTFGLNTMETDGHDIKKILSKLKLFKNYKGKKANILICNTTKGKGISFIENKPEFHHKILNDIQYKKALLELK